MKQTGGTIRTELEYWPAFVDILMTVLMVFVLQNVLQSALNAGSLEAAKIRQAQRMLQKAIEEEFQGEIRSGKVTVVPGVNLLQIRFSDEILFGSGTSELNPKGEQILDRCAHTLAQMPANLYDRIQVEGHTDQHRFKYDPDGNWKLSTARAVTVVERFKHHAVAEDKLSAAGYAEFRPVTDDNGNYRSDLSRRIELRVVFLAPRGRKSQLE